MMQTEPKGKKPVDTKKCITDDYECMKDCRNCPFPGAKCYQTKYNRYHTDLLIRKQ